MAKRQVELRKCPPRFEPIPVSLREGIAPRRGICSTYPADRYQDAFMTGNGTLSMMIFGEPLQEQLVFNHELLLTPKWKEPMRPPQIAHLLPQVRKLQLEGKFKEAALLSIPAGFSPATTVPNHRQHPAFFMRVTIPESGRVTDYLRTLDFMTGEAAVHWSDRRGKWLRRGFVSRADQIAVQQLSAPDRGDLDVNIRIDASIVLNAHVWELGEMPDCLTTGVELSTELLLLTGRYDESLGNIAYAAATRVVRNGGEARLEEGWLKVRGARSVTLLTKVERYQEFDSGAVKKLTDTLMGISADYDSC